ncbi:MAG: glycosyltransferase family 1 protein [Verrucomicrobia bacterium]|nr:MAG: glycosyltransferase family 1 protein [Verrucomicrobiota bacterium]
MKSGRKRIVIDCRWILHQSSGIGVYTRELVRALLSVGADEEYHLLFDDESLARRETHHLSRHANCQVWLVPWRPFSIAGQFTLPVRIRARADLYHGPNYMIPFLTFPRKRQGSPACVVTIHDLIPLRFPDHAPRARKSRLLPLYRFLVREAVLRADAVICPSNATLNDIVTQFNLSRERQSRLHVVPEGIPAGLKPDPAKREKYPLLLFVGRRDPYKNLPLLINAFARLRRTMPQVRLEVIGPPDPRYPEAEQLATRLKLGSAVTWRGYVPAEEMITAYQRAHAVVLPSRCEGFGLPVLEAMACGCPVICSRAGALPEVAADAALYVDPLTPEALAEAMVRVLTDRSLAQTLTCKGLARARLFSWERTARGTLAIYRRLLDGLRSEGNQ